LANVLSAQVFTGQPRRVQAALARLQEAEQRLHVSMAMAPGEHPLSLAQETPLSLQATIAISEQRLSEKARMALQALAVFPARPNSFSEEAAVAVGQMSPEVLDELWDAGLLESSGPERYQLHQTIADYERLQRQSPGVYQRLIGFTARYLQDHAQDYEALELELNNIRAALDVTVEVGMQRDLIAAMSMLVPFLQRRGRYLLASHYLQRAYEAAKALEDSHGQMMMLQYLALFTERLGEYQQAERYGMLGLGLARQLEELDAQCALLTTLGQVAFHQGNYSQSVTYCEQGLGLARQVGANWHICTLFDLLITIACQQGRYAQAQELAQEGLELARRQGDGESITNMLNDMAQVAQIRGDSVQAESFVLEALELASQLGYRGMQVKLLNGLAIIMQDRGNPTQSTAYLLRALELARQIGHRAFICVSLANLGDAMLIKGRYAEAGGYLLEGVELARQLGHQGLLVFLSNLGEAVGYQGDYARANTYFEESVQLARQQNVTSLLSGVLVSWGDIHLHHQHPDEAAQAYQEVLALEASVDVDQKMTAWAQYGLARVAALHGELAQARQLGQQSLVAFAAKSHYKAAEVRQWLQNLDRAQETN
ncbi:MAG: tetratricopeptide repeat protein, partial [Ktedonobacteraceae bacterium]|nr:tetratricopeptide repeat protein [Ktedonobacteraceae bacterium]